MIRNNDKGFTLLELLISLSIITIILLAFSTITISSIKGNTKNDKDISALNIAQSEIEVIRKQIKDRETNLKNSENKSIEKNTKEIYSKEIDGKKIEVELCVSEKEKFSQYILYKLCFSVEPKQKNEKSDYFSKKHTELVTEVFGYTVNEGSN